MSEGLEARVRELFAQRGRDIWLYGEGDLLSQLLEYNVKKSADGNS
ncbi:hypothetical protein [Paenibacillus pini]|nr:hypothetical protein [Paenibacillus pini]